MRVRCEGPAPARTGPSEIAPTRKLLASQSSAAGDNVRPLPLPWAQQLIANGGDSFPEYRSREWAALDDRDPRRVAACVQAAERWWRSRLAPAAVYALPTGRRAREIAEARRPRPGDYMGGPVRWDEVGGQ